MKKTKTSSFTLTLELQLNKSDFRFLKARENSAVSIYNSCLGQCLKRMHKLQHDREYQALLTEYINLKKQEVDTSDVTKALNQRKGYYGFTEYDMHEYVTSDKHHFETLGIDECQKLATRAFHAVEKLLYGTAEHVNFANRHDGITIEGKSQKSTLKAVYDGDDALVGIQFGKSHLFRFKPHRNKKDDAYISKAIQSRIKYVRLIYKNIRGKDRYYAQFVLEGTPPVKGRKYGPDIPVGIDEGVGTAAISCKGYVRLHELAPGCCPDAAKVRRIQRAMDRSRRVTNPDNYNSDGTVKPRNKRKPWVLSKRYKKLRQEYSDGNRILSGKRKQSHEMLANEVIAQGTNIRVEDMQIQALAKRSKKISRNKSGHIRSKKRFGKTIMNRAPAMLISIIERKLSYYGYQITKLDTFSTKLSQYDHAEDSYARKTLKDRLTVVGGHIVQRDMYSAFLVEHIDTKDLHIDRPSCIRDFDIFADACTKEINNIRNSGNRYLTWYVTQH